MRREWIWGVAALLAAAPVLADPEPITNVRLKSRPDRRWVRTMVEDAAERFARPECSRVLSELRDAEGRPLQVKLEATGVDARTYMLERVFFYDADQRSACRSDGVVAFTTPESRVVRICPRFGTLHGKSDDYTRAYLIHETLHTLGLGENLPSPSAITEVVLKHCR
jgi:hypothetical protein